ncbi:hypothetical protein ACTA71_000150 [Dictyostelium dimigraforme]
MSLSDWNRRIKIKVEGRLKKVDKDNDKKISKKEFIEDLGYDEKTYDQSEDKALFESLDADKDGNVSEIELYGRLDESFIKDVLNFIKENEGGNIGSYREKDDVLKIIKSSLKIPGGLDEKYVDNTITLITGLIEKDGKITQQSIIDAYNKVNTKKE